MSEVLTNFPQLKTLLYPATVRRLMLPHMIVRVVSSLGVMLLVFACGTTPATPNHDAMMPPVSGDGGTIPPGSDAGDVGDAAPPPPGLPTTIGTEERPASVVAPNDYDPATPTPLLFLLHGYSASSAVQDLYFNLSSVTRDLGVILVLPDGTEDRRGNQFWNADERCCDFGRTGVDDVAYLTGLLDEVATHYNVDAARVYFYGHSNGGYMSYRMACDLGDRVTAIASLAGATRTDDADCVRSRPVSVLQVHGTLDPTIIYTSTPDGHVGAVDGVERWATHAGCELSSVMGEARDFDTGIPGSETTVDIYNAGCTGGFVGEVWSIQGGGHIPRVNAMSTRQVVEWLLDRGPRPDSL